MNPNSVIVTGTSKGIGLETALTFGRAGYKVYATMRNPEQNPLLSEIAQKESLPISILKMDVDSDESVKHCIHEISKEVDSIDVLVNNAGIERHGSVEELEISDIKSVMETNYFGAIRCIKELLPTMRSNNNGCIINVTSIAGRLSNSPLGAYAASKFALEAISEALAIEVKPFNIRVALVEPGIIDTQMARGMNADGKSIYPSNRRMAGLFTASLENPTEPSLVADKILEIASNGTWQLRHPVGPDAEPYLGWRSSLSDEAWIDFQSADDETWYNAIERDFGLNARMEIPSTQ